jgi:hypothetical protein
MLLLTVKNLVKLQYESIHILLKIQMYNPERLHGFTGLILRPAIRDFSEEGRLNTFILAVDIVISTHVLGQALPTVPSQHAQIMYPPPPLNLN